MSRRVTIGATLIALVLSACGGGAVDIDVASTAPSSAPPTSDIAGTVPASLETTLSMGALASGSATPGIASITSGRGDDGSLEVGIWFASDPFGFGSTRILIGTDSNDSYPGVGDPLPHLDGWVEIEDSAVSLVAAGAVVANSESGDLGNRFSWTGPGRVVRAYFIDNVVKRAGTVWVAVEIDGMFGVGAIAGVDFGGACSYRGGGIDLGAVPGDTPDPGMPCRYPLG